MSRGRRERREEQSGGHFGPSFRQKRSKNQEILPEGREKRLPRGRQRRAEPLAKLSGEDREEKRRQWSGGRQRRSRTY